MATEIKAAPAPRLAGLFADAISVATVVGKWLGAGIVMAMQRTPIIPGFSRKQASGQSAARKLSRQIGAVIAAGVGIFLISTTDFAAHAALKSGRTAPAICAEAASETLKRNVPQSIRKAILSVCETALRGAANDAACDAAASKIMRDLGPLTANTCKTAVRINSGG